MPHCKDVDSSFRWHGDALYTASMQWEITPGLTPYADALTRMAEHVAAMRAGRADELIWLVEHPPTYTAGTSAKGADLLNPAFPVFETGRGGQYTYHGPGQRVVYLMLDLKERGRDVRAYVQQLERWIIATLAEFGVEGVTREGRIGVWVTQKGVGSGEWGVDADHANAAGHITRSADRASHEPAKLRGGLGSMPMSEATHEAKIAALGVRVQGWVTSHGIALNVAPDLSHYAGIVPCGIRGFGVTSLAALGVKVDMAAVDAALQKNLPF